MQKRSTISGLSKYGWLGLTFSAERSNPCSGYVVGMQYAVGVSAKRSTHTVDLANMGGGDCYL